MIPSSYIIFMGLYSLTYKTELECLHLYISSGYKKTHEPRMKITKYTHALRIYCYNHRFEDKDNLFVNSNTSNL